MLTKRQKEILDFVENYLRKKGYAPSFDEIRKFLKVASVSTVDFHISKLKKGGYLKKQKIKFGQSILSKNRYWNIHFW